MQGRYAYETTTKRREVGNKTTIKIFPSDFVSVYKRVTKVTAIIVSLVS